MVLSSTETGTFASTLTTAAALPDPMPAAAFAPGEGDLVTVRGSLAQVTQRAQGGSTLTVLFLLSGREEVVDARAGGSPPADATTDASWACPKCTLLNAFAHKLCAVCDTKRPRLR